MRSSQWTEWAAAARRGDRGSFRRLVDSATRTLIALAFRYTRDWESARDLAQETWIKVHRAWESYDPVRSFPAWLYTVHRNTCLSYLRSNAARREVPTAPADIAALAPAGGESTNERVERREFLDRLDAALGKLPDSQQIVFRKVHMEHLSQREAAEALGMSFATLRTTLHFARKRLARILRGQVDAS